MNARGLLALVAVLLTAGCSRADQPAAPDPVVQELARLESVQKKIESAELPEMLRELVAPNRKALDTAAGTADPLLRLYRTRGAFIGIETLAYVAAHEEAGKSVEALEAVWKTGKAGADANGAASLLVTALRQCSANRAEKLYRASLPYGRVSSPMSGLYYLAEGEANVRFAAWLSSLGGGAEPAPPAAGVRAALESVDAETQRVFEKDPSGRTSIAASAKLKEARELLERGSIAGAALTVAEARLALSRAVAAGQAPAEVPAGQAAGDSMTKVFAAMNDPLANRDVMPLLQEMRRSE